MRKSNKKWAEAFRKRFPILLVKKKIEIGEKLKKLSTFITFSHYHSRSLPPKYSARSLVLWNDKNVDNFFDFASISIFFSALVWVPGTQVSKTIKIALGKI